MLIALFFANWKVHHKLDTACKWTLEAFFQKFGVVYGELSDSVRDFFFLNNNTFLF